MEEKLYKFDNWLDWIFDREVKKPVWFFERGITYVLPHMITLSHLTRLFREPGFLLKHYLVEQIEQGLWVIAGAGGIMTPALTDNESPLNSRAKCISLMENMFQHIFSAHSMDTICFMWWDDLISVISDFEDDGIIIPTGVKYANALRDEVFSALSKIIFIPSDICQRSALHALGHLQHPDGKKLIFKYLNSGLEISKETREYSRQCISGNIL